MAQVFNLNLKSDAASSPAQIPAITNTYIFGSLSLLPGMSYRLSQVALAIYGLAGLFFLLVAPEKSVGIALIVVAVTGKGVLEIMQSKAKDYIPHLLFSLWVMFVLLMAGTGMFASAILVMQVRAFAWLLMSLSLVGGLNHLQLHRSRSINCLLMLGVSSASIAMFGLLVRIIA